MVMAQTENTDSHPLVEFQLGEDDFADAFQLHFTPTRSGWLWGVVILSVTCTAAFLLLRYDNAPLWFQLLLPVGAALSGTLAGFAFWAVRAPRAGRRTYARQPLAHLTRRIAVRPEGLRVQSPRGESTLLWQDFIAWRTNGKTTLLYTSPHLFVLIPARLAALGVATDELKASLAREIGAPRR
jgi:hypothetical protein